MLNSHSEAPIEVWLVSASTRQAQNSQPSSTTQAHDPKQPFAGNLFVTKHLSPLLPCQVLQSPAGTARERGPGLSATLSAALQALSQVWLPVTAEGRASGGAIVNGMVSPGLLRIQNHEHDPDAWYEHEAPPSLGVTDLFFKSANEDMDIS